MKPRFTIRYALAGVAALALVFSAAACGDDDADAGTTEPTAATTTTTAAATGDAGSETGTVEVRANNLAFDTDEIRAKAGEALEVTFVNEEAIPHDIAFYTDDTATEKIGASDIVTSETTTFTLDVPAEPGTYFFHCDAHPNQMTGSLIVE